MLSTIKKAFLWNYARNTWQWDILCVLILVFIFLTPKSWFEGGERRAPPRHQSPAITTVLVGTEVIDNETDRSPLEQRVRTLSGRSDAQIVGVRKVLDKDGKVVGYQVDIR
ncbi:MAG: hypothetical protein H0T77_13485 [Pyrinomonadaceae bacterium]|nr:hypothetical protein [Pyrinomonadaceae bacterium]